MVPSIARLYFKKSTRLKSSFINVVILWATQNDEDFSRELSHDDLLSKNFFRGCLSIHHCLHEEIQKLTKKNIVKLRHSEKLFGPLKMFLRYTLSSAFIFFLESSFHFLKVTFLFFVSETAFVRKRRRK